MAGSAGLRHVVMFRFHPRATPSSIAKIEAEFQALAKTVPGIELFEWGTNNSPENLSDGFSHVFLLTFSRESDRDTYLSHPNHLKFVDILLSEGVLSAAKVLDYNAQPVSTADS